MAKQKFIYPANTQKGKIERVAKRSFITSMKAFKMGITQLGARIQEMEAKGFKFIKEWNDPKSCDYKKYKLA